ncbi:hypothetical protein VTO73DRAFT_9926 [Trametes versicolor]
MALSYTTLFVCEQPEVAPPETSSEALFLLLVCPSRPLEMGANVRLLLVFDPPNLVPFFPSPPEPPSRPSASISGAQVVEFEVENHNEEAPIRRARIVAPWLPGLTAGRDLRGPSGAGVPELPDIPELRGAVKNARPHYAADSRRAGEREVARRAGGKGRRGSAGMQETRGTAEGYEAWELSAEYANEQEGLYESFPSSLTDRHTPGARSLSPTGSDYWM